jgi:hypothetical protein
MEQGLPPEDIKYSLINEAYFNIADLSTLFRGQWHPLGNRFYDGLSLT